MRRKAKEIQQRNREMNKGGRNTGIGSGGSFGPTSFRTDVPVIESSGEPPKSSYAKSRFECINGVLFHCLFF